MSHIQCKHTPFSAVLSILGEGHHIHVCMTTPTHVAHGDHHHVGQESLDLAPWPERTGNSTRVAGLRHENANKINHKTCSTRNDANQLRMTTFQDTASEWMLLQLVSGSNDHECMSLFSDCNRLGLTAIHTKLLLQSCILKNIERTRNKRRWDTFFLYNISCTHVQRMTWIAKRANTSIHPKIQ